MLFNQEDIQKAHNEFVAKGVDKLVKYKVNTNFVLSIVTVFAILIAFIIVVHSNRVIARKASHVTCSSFASQEAAQMALKAARQSGDPTQWRIYKGLDANKDGIACNDLSK